MRRGSSWISLVLVAAALGGGQILVGATTASAAVMLPHLPADMDWWNGCSPTAAGMLMGWWDEEGYDVFPGSHRNLPATYDDTSSNPADYADARGVIAGWAHKQSGIQQGLTYGSYKNHAPDSLADFMLTQNGVSERANMAHGLKMFAAWDDPRTLAIESRQFTTSTYNVNNGWSYDNYCAEIDAGRPVHLGVQSGTTGHSVLGVGYDNTGGKQDIMVLTTWHWGVQEWKWANQPVQQYNFSVVAATLMQPVVAEIPEVSAYFSIAGAPANQLEVTLGAGTPSHPIWSTVVWSYGGSGTDRNLVMTDIDCTAMLDEFLAGETDWFLKVYYYNSYDPATIEDFQIRLAFDEMVFEWEAGPVSLKTFNSAYAYLTTAFIPGDATGDGVVDELDAQRLAANWGRTGATRRMGDFDGDDRVGSGDAAILAANWGRGAGEAIAAMPMPGAVPEPSAWLLLLGLMPVCFGRGIRR